MPNPKISVVTVCYNAADTIEETILSVLSQTYDNVEYIIIDGGSTDGTVDIIKKYTDHLAYWVSEPDKGIYDAMNKGIDAATGDYINFMNAGDRLINNSILTQVSEHLDSDSDIVYGDIITESETTQKRLYASPIEKMDVEDPIPHPSSFTKRVLFGNNKFDTSFKIAADYDFFYKQYYDKKKFTYINIPIAYFKDGGISSTSPRVRLLENYKVQNKPLTFGRKINIQYLVFRYNIKVLISTNFPRFWIILKKILGKQ